MIHRHTYGTHSPSAIVTLRDIGETKKQRGMAMAADVRAAAVAAGQVAMLRALLASPDGTATIDDATADLTHRFIGGGKWRGTVCRSLATAGITEAVGVARSDRPSRHRGYVTLWRLCDRDLAQQEIVRLTTAKRESPHRLPPSAGYVVSVDTDSKNSNGENEHASK